jgi:hypothetical protein
MTRPSLRTRKPVDALTPDDLAAFPIWEFAIDEEDEPDRDETWVRPVKAARVPRGRASLSVAADVETASGLRCDGFVGISTIEAVEIDALVLLVGGKYLFLSARHPETRTELCAALGVRESEAFPLRYRLRILIRGERALREGVVA